MQAAAGVSLDLDNFVSAGTITEQLIGGFEGFEPLLGLLTPDFEGLLLTASF